MSAARLSVRGLAERERLKESSVRGWIGRGVKVNGNRVRLAATRIGGRLWVDPEAYSRFVADCNPSDSASAVAESPVAP